MKKIYLMALTCFALSNMTAQMTLTKANSEPIIGDINYTKTIDTTGFNMPNTVTGQNVVWTLTNALEDGGKDTTTYVTPSTFTNSSTYTGATIASINTGSTVTYYKATATQYEVRGLDGGLYDLNFNSNTAIAAIYPVAYGYTNTDNFGGQMTVQGGGSGPFTGTVTTIADGTGDLDINGVVTYSNCLRVKSTQHITFSLTFGLITGTIDQTIYNYYHSSSKFPLLTINYQHVVTAGAQTLDNSIATVSLKESVPTVLPTGIKTFNKANNLFSVYPNPATNEVNIHLVTAKNETYNITILNTMGQVVKTKMVANVSAGMYDEVLNVSDLTSGMYTIHVKGTTANGTQKLMVK